MSTLWQISVAVKRLRNAQSARRIFHELREFAKDSDLRKHLSIYFQELTCGLRLAASKNRELQYTQIGGEPHDHRFELSEEGNSRQA
jgi:hypothetical protein